MKFNEWLKLKEAWLGGDPTDPMNDPEHPSHARREVNRRKLANIKRLWRGNEAGMHLLGNFENCDVYADLGAGAIILRHGNKPQDEQYFSLKQLQTLPPDHIAVRAAKYFKDAFGNYPFLASS